MPKVESLFVQMTNKDNLCLSMAIDRSILLDKDELGKYDHIVITDQAWVNATSVDNKISSVGHLIPIRYEDIHEELKDFLSGQLPIWTKTGEIQPEGIGFYEYQGDSFLVLPPNVGFGESTMQAKNPLIILVDDAVKTLKLGSFLLPMASSGMLFSKTKLFYAMPLLNRQSWKRFHILIRLQKVLCNMRNYSSVSPCITLQRVHCALFQWELQES